VRIVIAANAPKGILRRHRFRIHQSARAPGGLMRITGIAGSTRKAAVKECGK